MLGRTQPCCLQIITTSATSYAVKLERPSLTNFFSRNILSTSARVFSNGTCGEVNPVVLLLRVRGVSYIAVCCVQVEDVDCVCSKLL